MGTCFFIGHRDAPAYLRKQIAEAVEKCIVKCGITDFIVGNYGQFDRMCAGVLGELKKAYPQIHTQFLIPYHPAVRTPVLPTELDGTYYPFETTVPPRLAIRLANEYVIRSSDYLICYVSHPGNASNLLEYARKQSIQIINLAQKEHSL